jgi:hypothetical protein
MFEIISIILLGIIAFSILCSETEDEPGAALSKMLGLLMLTVPMATLFVNLFN